MQQPTKLIFLPGAAGNPDFWQPVSGLLTYPASRVLLGWPGFGAVPADPQIQGIADLAAMVVREIDQPTALISQSMGGVIALLAAWQRPELVTRLVLAVTAGGIDMSEMGALDWRPGFLANNPQAPRWFAEYRNDLSGELGSLHVPSLLLCGDADPVSPVAVGKRLRELLPNSRLHVVAGGAHDLANEQG